MAESLRLERWLTGNFKVKAAVCQRRRRSVWYLVLIQVLHAAMIIIDKPCMKLLKLVDEYEVPMYHGALMGSMISNIVPAKPHLSLTKIPALKKIY